MMDASEIAEQLILIRRLADATYEAESAREGYPEGKAKKVYEEELGRLIRHLKPILPLGSAEKPFPAEET